MGAPTVSLETFVDDGLGHSSYLVDLGDGSALVIDPPRFADAHERAAQARGLRIAWTADTHSHADYVSGSPELVARGTRFIAPKACRLETPHVPVEPGDEIVLAPGRTLRAIATPGHTPEHLAYLLIDADRPAALFSGGSLMVGTVGRTDLLGPEQAEPLARRLYRALRDDIAVLPDDLPVYPTHGAGSFCSAPGASERSTTIGRERTTNPLFSINDEDAFVRELLAGFGTFPPYFQRLPELNRRGPRLYGEPPTLERLNASRVRALLDAGAVVVDARRFDAYADGHIPGSLSIALRSVFASWLGWLVDPESTVIFVLDPDQDRATLVRACLDVGHENLVGELDGGIDAWRAGGGTLTTTPLVEPGVITDGTLIDVRQHNEYETAHIDRALNIELGTLRDAVLPDTPVTLMCGHGERAMTGASVLERRGRTDVTVRYGGPGEWSTATVESLAKT
jgi:glyoxylase-like metal-dependent hydrolase (beta-lactamase superfamily II)/rhodanese-related sulfurtransferase